MKIIMIVDIPPGLILIIGAFLVPLIPTGWLRKGYLLLLPVAGLLSLLSLGHGSLGEVSIFGYELKHVRNDAHSFVFGIIFYIAAFVAILFSLHSKDVLEQTAALAYAGAAIGAALTGLRPVVDLMYFDFTTVAFDQLLSNAAKSRYMFGGQTKVPLTLFARSGSGTGHAAQHSSAFYSILAHIPGLKVVTPSDPYSVKGLLSAAIRDDDPVFVVNDKKLINMTGFVPDEDYRIELGKGRYLRKGSDVTLVGMSYTSVVCKEAAEKLEKLDIDAEVIDLMSLSPLDEQIIIDSVSKTNSCLLYTSDAADE